MRIWENDYNKELIMGHTILIAERAYVFTNRATKMVSTVVYSPMKIIITMVGKAKRRGDPVLQFRSKIGSFMAAVLLFSWYPPMGLVLSVLKGRLLVHGLEDGSKGLLAFVAGDHFMGVHGFRPSFLLQDTQAEYHASRSFFS